MQHKVFIFVKWKRIADIKVIIETSIDQNRLKNMKVKYIKLKIIYFNIILLMVLMKKKSKYSVGDLEYSVLDRSQSFTNTQRYLEEVNTQYIDVTLDQIFTN